MPSSKKHSQQKEAFCKKEADRQSNLSTSVSVSQFLFFQPAFLLATTWQPHETNQFPILCAEEIVTGVSKTFQDPRKSMNHETYDDQILMDLLDLPWCMHSQVLTPQWVCNESR
jgi:hypothetical protein